MKTAQKIEMINCRLKKMNIWNSGPAIPSAVSTYPAKVKKAAAYDRLKESLLNATTFPKSFQEWFRLIIEEAENES